MSNFDLFLLSMFSLFLYFLPCKSLNVFSLPLFYAHLETNEDEESERDVESDERKDDGLLLLKRECVREREKLI